MSLTVTLVYNPKSGSAPSLTDLRNLAERQGVKINSTIELSDSLARNLKPAISRKAIIMTIGGDGTISSVAALVADTKATLLPLPGGTLNNFTKDLGISQDIEQALKNATSARPKQIDIASVENTHFINNSGIGIYPRSLQTRKRFEDHLGKWPAAAVAVIRTLVRFRNYKVCINGKEYKTPFIFIGNNPYTLKGIDRPHRIHLDKGQLFVLIATATTRIGIIKTILKAAVGSIQNDESLDSFVATSVTISSRHHRHVNVSHDGEVSRLSLPLTYKIHEKALRILY